MDPLVQFAAGLSFDGGEVVAAGPEPGVGVEVVAHGVALGGCQTGCPRMVVGSARGSQEAGVAQLEGGGGSREEQQGGAAHVSGAVAFLHELHEQEQGEQFCAQPLAVTDDAHPGIEQQVEAQRLPQQAVVAVDVPYLFTAQQAQGAYCQQQRPAQTQLEQAVPQSPVAGAWCAAGQAAKVARGQTE